MSDPTIFQPLKDYLSKIPGVEGAMGCGFSDDGCWWLKFTINIDHPLAWNVVQELGHVLNYVSLDERLPTVFMPVSPPPYMNGGPREFLSWVIECRDKEFRPETCAEWLEGRLPRPVEDTAQWTPEDDDDVTSQQLAEGYPFGVKILCVDAGSYPDALEPNLVGTYSPVAKAGGGYVWDDVLEYRVWCHPERGSPDLEDGNDYYYPFATYAEALAFSQRTEGAEAPLALIRQLEYIAEPNPGDYKHVKEERIAEWPVEFLRRPRRAPNTIPDFLSPNAPANKLDILRGLTGPK